MTNRATAETILYLPLFVYGTLLPGQPNHALWADAIRCLRPATLADHCLLDLGPYPMMVARTGHSVVGLLADVDPAAFADVLAALDYLEGFDPAHPSESEYRRERRIVCAADGRPRAAWTYVGHPAAEPVPLIPGGNWKRHVRGQDRRLAEWWAGVTTVGR